MKFLNITAMSPSYYHYGDNLQRAICLDPLGFKPFGGNSDP